MSSTALSSIDKISPFITWPFCCWHCWLLLLVFLHIIQESYSTWACREWAVVLLELTDSYRRLVRGYSHSFFILLSWLLWLYSSGFPFLPLTTLQTSMQALLPILWGWCSQGSILGVQLLCAFVAANPYFLNTTSVLMISKYISSAPTLILKLQISTFYLSISGHFLLDYAYWTPYMQTWTYLTPPKAKTLAVFLCQLVPSLLS